MDPGPAFALAAAAGPFAAAALALAAAEPAPADEALAAEALGFPGTTTQAPPTQLPAGPVRGTGEPTRSGTAAGGGACRRRISTHALCMGAASGVARLAVGSSKRQAGQVCAVKRKRQPGPDR